MLRDNFGDDVDSMDYGTKQMFKDYFQRPDGTFDSPVKYQDNLINKAFTDTKIAASDFDKEGYDNFLKNYPYISSPINITRVEVWVTNRQLQTSNVRNLVAIQDLGERDINNTRSSN